MPGHINYVLHSSMITYNSGIVRVEILTVVVVVVGWTDEDCGHPDYPV